MSPPRSLRRAAVLAALAAALASARCAGRQSPGATMTSARSAAADRFDALAREYYAARFRHKPVEATATGVHAHDDALDDLSREGVARYGAWLAAQRDALTALIPALPETRTVALDARGAPDPMHLLSDRPRLDAELLRDTIAAEHASLVEWHELDKSPGAFHQLAADAVYQLVVRDFAPAPVRARAATARLRAVPALLAAGERWLEHPSRLAVEVALRELPGSIEIVRDVFTAFVRDAPDLDSATREAALGAARDAVAALERHGAFLSATLLPRATGDYHDGRARWTRRAALLEGVTEAPELLRDAARAEVTRIQDEMRRVAARMAPGEPFRAVLARQRDDHPGAAELLSAYRAQQDAIRAFVRARSLVTIDPARDDLTISETPGFMRATTFAALSAPGALEQVDRHTLFYVTPADTTRPPDEVAQYLTEHSRSGIAITSIHEAYPGHHVQGIAQRRAPSLVRQLLWHGTYGEGWAHYTEQMMLDEGFGDDALRLAQLNDALLRACRAYLDVAVHVFGASYDEAVAFYRDEGFMSQPGAEMEARRVCLHPASVFVYTYGKLAIFRLRRAVVDTGPRVPLAAFHDALLGFGSAPLPRLARALWGVELGAWRPGEVPRG